MLVLLLVTGGAALLNVACEPVRPFLAEQVIGPDGGQITSSDGRLTLFVPSGALASEHTISIRKFPDVLPDTLQELDAECIYDLGPDGLTFDEPVTVRFDAGPIPSSGSGPIEVEPRVLLTTAGGTVEELGALRTLVEAERSLLQTLGELTHFSPIVITRSGVKVLVSGVPPGLPVDETFEAFVAVESTEVGQELTVAFFADDSGPPVRILTGESEEEQALERPGDPDSTLPVQVRAGEFEYGCAEAGVGHFFGEIGITLDEFADRDHITIFASRRVYCYVDDEQTSGTGDADALGFSLSPAAVVQNVGEDFRVRSRLRLPPSAGSDIVGLDVVDLNPGVVALPPTLVTFVGADAVTELLDLDPPGDNTPDAVIPYNLQGVSAGVRAEQLWEYTCVSPGETVLVYAASVPGNQTSLSDQALSVDVTCGEDADRDGDGVPNDEDAFPDDPDEQTDTDGDGTGDNADTDDDGDGVEDAQDAFPKDPSESADSDGDGVGDNSDVCAETPSDEVADADGCSPSQGDGGQDEVADAGVTGPTGLSILPNPFGELDLGTNCSFVLVVAGGDGMALFDPCAEQVLLTLDLPDGSDGLFGVTPLEPVEDINDQTLHWLLGFGESGWYLQELRPDLQGGLQGGAIRPAVDGPTEGITAAANPAGDTEDDGGSTTTVVTEAQAGRVVLERVELLAAGAYDGFAVEDEEIADFSEGDFPDAEGVPVAAELSADGAIALAVTQGPSQNENGRMYSFTRSPVSGDFLDGELEGEVGADPRDILVRENPSPQSGEGIMAGVVLNFGSDSLTPFSVMADGTVQLWAQVPAGDGPVNGDIRITAEDTVEVVNTGVNDGSVYLARYDWNGNIFAGAFGQVPAACLQPEDVQFDPTDPDVGYVSCNGSDYIAVIDLGAIRVNF